MSQRIMKSLLFAFVLIVLAVFSVMVIVPSVSLGQSDETNNLRSHLTTIRDNHMSAYIQFIAPLDENPGWDVPEDFTNEDGAIVGRRLIGEIGEDFVCIDKIGQGFTITDCVPFSNIASIRQPAL